MGVLYKPGESDLQRRQHTHFQQVGTLTRALRTVPEILNQLHAYNDADVVVKILDAALLMAKAYYEKDKAAILKAREEASIQELQPLPKQVEPVDQVSQVASVTETWRSYVNSALGQPIQLSVAEIIAARRAEQGNKK